jgi:hypothetical protein
MDYSQTRDTKDAKVKNTENDGGEDIAIGLQEEVTDYDFLRSWKWSTLYRSVLFQMVMFGA